jgi:hypothetical protein
MAGGRRAAAPPRLVVVVVIDQMASGTLESMRDRFSGGLKRFLDKGRIFPRCDHDHAVTETGPGHATLLSGLHPGHNGIIANDWHDPVARRDVYCVGDPSPGASRNFDGSEATSAARLRGENFADLLKRVSPGSKVFTVAGKDRSAILTAGHHADGAFWYSMKTGGFTSNPGIVAALPAWGSEFWSADPYTTSLYRENVPDLWTYPIRSGPMPDDYPYENATFSRTAPHPLVKPDPQETPDKRVAAIARRVMGSPWADWLTLKLAERILDAEGLGRDLSPDLLVVSLAGVDYVGHDYGPGSQEFLDHLLRVDAWLGEFMRRADDAAGGEEVLFVLSADHGVLPLPETVPGARRVDFENLGRRLEEGLAHRLGGEGAPAEGPFIESEQSRNLYLNRSTLARLKIPLERAVEETRRELLGLWEVARVYRRSDLAAGTAPTDPYLDVYRNAFDPERSGDLIIQPCERCLFTSRPEGTSHGSPYEYDRLVPMIFLGPSVRPGRDAGECRTVDLAPSLAALLGMSFEAPRDGRPLLATRHVDRAPARK